MTIALLAPPVSEDVRSSDFVPDGAPELVRAGDLQGGEIIRCRDRTFGVVLKHFGRYREGLAVDFWDAPARFVPRAEWVEIVS